MTSVEPRVQNVHGRARGLRLPRKARRAQLLDAALEVFVAQGYHAAAMDEIAEQAGISKPVLYQHFPSKLGLYLALVEQSSDQIIDACREALSSTHDNRVRVQATFAAFYDYVANAQGGFRLVFESDLTSEPAVRAQVDRVTHVCAEEISKVIQEDTGLPDQAANLLAVSLVGMAQVSARYWLDSGSPMGETSAADMISALAWRGISGFPLTDEH